MSLDQEVLAAMREAHDPNSEAWTHMVKLVSYRLAMSTYPEVEERASMATAAQLVGMSEEEMRAVLFATIATLAKAYYAAEPESAGLAAARIAADLVRSGGE